MIFFSQVMSPALPTAYLTRRDVTSRDEKVRIIVKRVMSVYKEVSLVNLRY